MFAWLAAASLPCLAADKTWDGGGDQVNWSASPANWDADTVPVANDRLFFDGSVGLTPNNDFAVDTDFAGIIFNANAGAFTISGNEIDIAANAGITNFSTNVQTFIANVDNNGAAKVHNAAVGPIVYSGLLRANQIIKEGTNSVTLNGGGDNPSLGAVVNNGMLILGKSANRALGAGVTINTNGILRTIGPGTDQIHFNQRITMNGGRFQLQHVNSTTSVQLEEVASLSGSNLDSIVENGLPGPTNRLDIGGGNNHRGIYSGTLRDGAAGVLALQVYRGNNFEQLNGTNTYTGPTLVNNTQAAGAARLIVNGAHIGAGPYTVNGHATDTTRLAYLHGGGVISATVVNFNANSLLSPGGSLSADLVDTAAFNDAPATLTFSNAVNLNAATASLEIQLNGTTAGTSYDQVVIAGSGTFSNNNANLKLPTPGYSPVPGDKFTIVKVEGTDSSKTMGVFAFLNGTATDLSQGATFIEPSSGKTFRISYRAEGNTFDAGAGNGNDIMLEVVATSGSSLTWRGDVNNAWDIVTTPNWRTLGGSATTFTNGDNVTFNSTGSNSLPIDLTSDVSPGNVLVDSPTDYIFGTSTTGKFAGTIVLTKTNTGTLTIVTDNNNAGSTLVRAGTLRIGTNSTSGTLSGALDIRTNATVIFDRADVSTFAGSITGGGNLAKNGDGTIILTANSTFAGGATVNSGTLQFGDGAGVSGSILSTVTNRATINYSFNNAITINNSLSGTGVVNLINTSTASRRFSMGGGPASLTNNTFSGTINVGPLVNLGTPDGSNGTNQLGVGSSIFVQDTGSVLLDRNGTYRSTFFLQGVGNGAGNAGIMALELEQGTTIVGDVILLTDTTIGGFLGTTRISGRILGTNGFETLTFANRRSGATSFELQVGSAAGPNMWGATVIDPGDLLGQQIRVTAMSPRAISTNGLSIGAHGIFQLNGFNHTVANLSSLGLDGTFVPAVYNGNASNTAVSFQHSGIRSLEFT